MDHADRLGGHITAVISSNPDAYALTRAEQAGIPGITIARKDFGSAACRP